MSRLRNAERLDRLLLWATICFLILSLSCSQPSPKRAAELPARFEDGRIFIDLAIRGGDTLQFYTDTGGGLFIYGEAVDRIKWEDTLGVTLGDLALERNFPEPLGVPDHRFPILRPEAGGEQDYDGLLGQAWFANRIWTFDYASQKLLLHPDLPIQGPDTRTVQLGFLTDSTGMRLLSFPRLTVLVDGDTLDMLFDTGAMVHLNRKSAQPFGNSSLTPIATSFITSEILERWRARHPDWPLIPNADKRVGEMAMIQVPKVIIGGVTVGPVWFTERPTTNFHDYMSQWMDRQIDGAIGGNILQFFKITLDYQAALAHFVLADDPG